MFSTFTTEHGALVIRTQDIRRIEDVAEGCTLGFAEEGHMTYMPIQGTAVENLERLFMEDQARAAAYARSQAAMQQGLPMPPVPRGKVAHRG